MANNGCACVTRYHASRRDGGGTDLECSRNGAKVAKVAVEYCLGDE